jgi:hypothetical protein
MCCLATAVILFVSQSLPTNGSIHATICYNHQHHTWSYHCVLLRLGVHSPDRAASGLESRGLCLYYEISGGVRLVAFIVERQN